MMSDNVDDYDYYDDYENYDTNRLCNFAITNAILIDDYQKQLKNLKWTKNAVKPQGNSRLLRSMRGKKEQTYAAKPEDNLSVYGILWGKVFRGEILGFLYCGGKKYEFFIIVAFSRREAVKKMSGGKPDFSCMSS